MDELTFENKNNFPLWKNIFGRCWALWALICFMLSFLIIFIPAMFAHMFRNEKKGQIYFVKISKIWMRVWLWLVGCPVRVTGRENFSKDENYVVVFNHNALLDVPISSPFIPGANKTIAKESFAKVPLFGFFYTKGSVLVDRKNDRSRVRSLEQMKETLAKGMHMCIYPEGTRNRTAAPLKSFYDGAFKLAIDSKKAVIPGIIIGTKTAMPIHKKFYLFPTPLKLQFLPPVGFENESVASLKEKVFALMHDRYVQETSSITNQ